MLATCELGEIDPNDELQGRGVVSRCVITVVYILYSQIYSGYCIEPVFFS